MGLLKFAVLAAVLVSALASPQYHHKEEVQEHYAPPKYEFKYAVKDEHTHDIKEQHEVRDGENVKGFYSLVEPDGTRRVVHYKVEGKSGFQAVVTKEGHASHPQQAPQQQHQHQAAPAQQQHHHQAAPAQQQHHYQAAPAQQQHHYQAAPAQQQHHYQAAPAQQVHQYQAAPAQQLHHYQAAPAQQQQKQAYAYQSVALAAPVKQIQPVAYAHAPVQAQQQHTYVHQSAPVKHIQPVAYAHAPVQNEQHQAYAYSSVKLGHNAQSAGSSGQTQRAY